MSSFSSHDLAELRAAYVSRVNMAVEADREDIARELAQDYVADIIDAAAALPDDDEDEDGCADEPRPH